MRIRCFIAILLPADVKVAIGRMIHALKSCGADIRWVATDKIHLTLKFLGETEGKAVSAIEAAISKKLLHYNAFCIRITEAGCFPSEKRPTVLWVGLEDSAILGSLQRDIEKVLVDYGYAPDGRNFVPHLTIGRVRSQKGMIEFMKAYEKFRGSDFGSADVNGIDIMKSELTPAGAEYTSLIRIPLKDREE